MTWKFGGRFMSSIDDAVVRAEVRAGDEQRMSHMLTRDPVDILICARIHCHDYEACARLGGIVDCYLTGLTAQCLCGRLEGEHGKFSEACPDRPGYFLPKPSKREECPFPDVHVSRAWRMGQ